MLDRFPVVPPAFTRDRMYTLSVDGDTVEVARRDT